MQSESVGIEKIILTNLLCDLSYLRKVFPYLKSEYFTDNTERLVFKHIQSFIEKYSEAPTSAALLISLSSDSDITEESHNSAKELLLELAQTEKPNEEWLLKETEKFCQEKSIYIAVLKTIKVFQGEDKTHEVGSIPKLLSDAIAVSFDPRVGHEYIEDAEKRFEFYHRKEEKLPFDLTYLNKITDGGIVNKSLSIVLAGTGVGKSLALCHFAAANLAMGKNVLYITLEMSEEKISERVDANLIDVPIQDIKNMPRESFLRKISDIRSKTVGKLVVKEYPTSIANTNHFRHLLNELKIKKNFVPDVIYVDYLNLCASSRVKFTASVNSYTYIKSIAEELRGLAVEFNVPIISATQTNRAGWANSDLGLENTAESAGLPATADLMFALISTEELEGLNQILIKQLKNRYCDVSKYRKFVVGINRSKMRLYDLEESAQKALDKGSDAKEEKIQTGKTRKAKVEKSKFDDIVFDDDMF